MAAQRQFSATSQALLLILASAILNVSNGLQYKVGGSIWSIPPYPTYYSNWSSSHHFLVGDILVFEFESGFYNVMQVSRREYKACTADNPFRSFHAGPARVPLIEKGMFYFICSVSYYCSLGQKVEVAVYHPVPVIVRPPPVPATVTTTPAPSCSPKQLLGKGMGRSHEHFIQALQHQPLLFLCLLVTFLIVMDFHFMGSPVISALA
ncbi:cucumber peeling cupredoxin-like [Eucalyptus grandis]|uniref:cucumber peeling cupredoxin-like n=1 Tax=Eucalyptus grandis TaxID=71139 RepID=UPI0005251386|nr:cucumber peeling cupredoxin-like [Eucalyptus grandis]